MTTSQAMTSDRLAATWPGLWFPWSARWLAAAGHTLAQLAGAGIGIAAAVDADGVLRAPPLHTEWDGLPLAADLAASSAAR